MTTEKFLIYYCIGLTLAVAYLLASHYADRIHRMATYSEMGLCLSRCHTAEKNCTKFELKSAEHSSAAHHAAKYAERMAGDVQGWHDCFILKIPAKTDDTVDFEPTPTIDPEGRTGEMGGQQ